jgi:Ca-activated chloride channel homolog
MLIAVRLVEDFIMPLDMHLLRPFWILALLPLALLLWALWRQPHRDANRWQTLIAPHLLPHLLTSASGQPQRLPLILLGLSWTLLVLALAGPVWQRLPQPLFSSGGQRVILLDLSPSLNAADIVPSRLARARFEILDLLRGATEGQVALLAFGAEPFVVAPLTGDAQTIAAQVPLLTGALLPEVGERRTDLALQLAGDLLQQAQAPAGDVILVTDAVGEFAAARAAAQQLAAVGHRVSVLAIGTAQGAPIPTGGGGFIQNAAGAVEMARLDSAALQQLATAGGGRYVAAAVGDADTQTLLALGAPRLTTDATATALTADQWREEGAWFLLPVLALAAVAFRRGWLLPVLAGIFLLPPPSTAAATWTELWQRPDQQAAAQLATGAAQAAAEQFEDPAWRAAARYRAGDFQGALTALHGLTGVAADYNRGNALAQLGRLDEAAAAYRQALQQAPDHADAQHNLEQVERLLKQQANQKQTPQSAEKSPPKSPSSKDGDAAEQSPPDPPLPKGEAAAKQSPADEKGSASKPPFEQSPQPPLPKGEAAAEQSPADEKGSASKSADEKGELGEFREQQQALDAQLQRVPDDPAGLLRQRFFLQHLRREGRLP